MAVSRRLLSTAILATRHFQPLLKPYKPIRSYASASDSFSTSTLTGQIRIAEGKKASILDRLKQDRLVPAETSKLKEALLKAEIEHLELSYHQDVKTLEQLQAPNALESDFQKLRKIHELEEKIRQTTQQLMEKDEILEKNYGKPSSKKDS